LVAESGLLEWQVREVSVEFFDSRSGNELREM